LPPINKIDNTVYKYLVKDDYERAITISFGKKAQVLTCEISGGIKTSISALDDSIAIRSTLLNKGDYHEIKALVSDYEGENLVFGGRIVGVKEIKKYTESKLRYIPDLAAAAIFLISIWLFDTYNNAIFIFFAFSGYLIMFIGKFVIKRLKKGSKY
jgi:hypothetical protein